MLVFNLYKRYYYNMEKKNTMPIFKSRIYNTAINQKVIFATIPGNNISLKYQHEHFSVIHDILI